MATTFDKDELTFFVSSTYVIVDGQEVLKPTLYVREGDSGRFIPFYIWEKERYLDELAEKERSAGGGK